MGHYDLRILRCAPTAAGECVNDAVPPGIAAGRGELDAPHNSAGCLFFDRLLQPLLGHLWYQYWNITWADAFRAQT